MRYLFIPSCEVAPCDRLSGTTTEKRLISGLQIWRCGGYDMIIVSGGVYLPPEIQKTPSGRLMKKWLVRKGVPASNIIAEEYSRDTYENISYSLLLLEDVAPQFTVVTHWQHAIRFRLTFKLANKMKVRTKPIYCWGGLKNFLFEWLILLIHLLDRRGTGTVARKNRESRTY